MKTYLLRTAMAASGLLVSPCAFAELSSGTYDIYAASASRYALYGGQITATGAGTLEEHWVLPLSDAWSAADFSVAARSPAPFRARLRPGRCPALVSFSFTYEYEYPDENELRDLIDAAATDPDPTLADRVLIDGETVGWRIRQRRLDGTIDEAWILTADYAPPRPSATTPRADAFQEGWARPYVDQIAVLDAPVDEVLAEVSVAAADPFRLARYSYTPRPATAAERAEVCPR